MPLGPRWADLLDSSNEGFSKPPPAPPITTDSYRETIEASRDADSKVGLTRRLSSVVDLSDAPTDFAFLLRDGKPRDGGCGAQAEAVEEQGPTRSAGEAGGGCLDGACSALDSSSAARPAVGDGGRRMLQSAASLNQVPTDFAFLLDHSKKDAGPVPGTPPCLKRTGHQEQANSSWKRPRATDSRSCGYSAAPSMRSPPAEPSEESWRRRAEKRQLSVIACKATPEYTAYSAAVPRSERRGAEPQTPDPLNRAISKRQWDEQVRLWRSALRKWCSDRGGCDAGVPGEARICGARHDV